MSNALPGKDEQCQALIEDTAYELALRSLPRDQSGRPQYRKVFNVTRTEVERYAREHYRLEDLVKMAPGPDAGFYAIPTSEGYLTYEQEREIPWGKAIVHSVDDVWRLLVDYRLRYSGTGFKFE